MTHLPSFSPSSSRAFGHGLVQGFLRDWRRWSRAERVAAACLAAMLFCAVPAILLSASLTGIGR